MLPAGKALHTCVCVLLLLCVCVFVCVAIACVCVCDCCVCRTKRGINMEWACCVFAYAALCVRCSVCVCLCEYDSVCVWEGCVCLCVWFGRCRHVVDIIDWFSCQLHNHSSVIVQLLSRRPACAPPTYLDYAHYTVACSRCQWLAWWGEVGSLVVCVCVHCPRVWQINQQAAECQAIVSRLLLLLLPPPPSHTTRCCCCCCCCC